MNISDLILLLNEGVVAFGCGLWLGVVIGALITIYIKAMARRAL